MKCFPGRAGKQLSRPGWSTWLGSIQTFNGNCRADRHGVGECSNSQVCKGLGTSTAGHCQPFCSMETFKEEQDKMFPGCRALPVTSSSAQLSQGLVLPLPGDQVYLGSRKAMLSPEPSLWCSCYVVALREKPESCRAIKQPVCWAGDKHGSGGGCWSVRKLVPGTNPCGPHLDGLPYQSSGKR